MPMAVKAVHVLQMLPVGLHDGQLVLSAGVYALRLLLVPMPVSGYGQWTASLRESCGSCFIGRGATKSVHAKRSLGSCHAFELKGQCATRCGENSCAQTSPSLTTTFGANTVA
ncbi:hypothetical protein BDV11DRAFT_113627 [Aspergillus similis]